MNKQMLESFERMYKNTSSQKKKLVESVGKFIIMHKSGKFFWNDERAKFVKNIDDASIFQLSQEAEDALFNAKELYLDRYPEAENSDSIITTTYDNALSILDKLNHYAKGKNQGGDRKEAYQKVFDKFNISGAYPGKLDYEFDGKDGHYKTYGLKGTNNTGSRGWTNTVNFILRVTEPSGKHIFIGTAKELDAYLMNKVVESSSTVDLKESIEDWEELESDETKNDEGEWCSITLWYNHKLNEYRIILGDDHPDDGYENFSTNDREEAYAEWDYYLSEPLYNDDYEDNYDEDESTDTENNKALFFYRVLLKDGVKNYAVSEDPRKLKALDYKPGYEYCLEWKNNQFIDFPHGKMNFMNNVVGSKEAAQEYCTKFPNMKLIENLDNKAAQLRSIKESIEDDLIDALPDVTAEEVQTVIDWLKTSPFINNTIKAGERVLYIASGINDDGISEKSKKILRDFESREPQEILDRLDRHIHVYNIEDASRSIKYLEKLLDRIKGKNESLGSLKESLGSSKFNKIQSLIKECLKEGMEVEITIPKKRK